MKYILLCVLALAVCLICGRIPARCIGKKKHFSPVGTGLLTIAFGLLFICIVTVGYLSVYYHADATAEISVREVRMEEIDGGYFFNGPGEETALIFYPGAKVDALAYTPMMTALAEQGVDCFLADMPFRMAIFGSSYADKFVNAYTYDHWAAAGHSMGGLVVSGYAADHADRIESLILLAAYPGDMIPDSIRLCSIYGTQDGCLNREVYEQSKEYWPEDASEVILEGGNHAGYANYGPQSGDLGAELSAEKQQEQTVKTILEMLGEEHME